MRTPRVTIILQGGLGNQLFQYALGRQIQHALSADVFYDASRIAKKNGRHYALDMFATKISLATDAAPHSATERILARLRGIHFITEKNDTDASSLFARVQKGGTFYLDGYWQNEEYFKSVRKQLLQEITLTDPLSPAARMLEGSIAAGTSVSLHVRRGDYVNNPGAANTHGALPAEYYQSAIAVVQKRSPSARFFVFSDDIPWCRESLTLPEDTVYASGTGATDEEELILMSRCTHHIVANSSFSWWGAWLDPKEDALRIAPKRWYRDPSIKEHIVPGSWTRV